MMEAVDLPKDLIRFASEENIEKKTRFKFTARLKGYTAVLFILTSVLIGMLFLRSDLEANIFRLPGQLYEHKEGTLISNVYTYKLLNKTSKDFKNIHFKIVSHSGSIEPVKGYILVPALGMAEGTLFIVIDQSALENEKEKLKIEVYSEDVLIETTKTNFLGPRSYR